ncbi:MAG: hypothetical protein K2X66_10515 [Cyanobacteria bacterium]|nr:hypothetical protein [Cyanobacteriota bacterium]
MDFQRNTETQEPLVLQYQQRRYDGGSEIELIRYIEEKQALKLQETDVIVPQVVLQVSKKTKMMEVLLMGPMEIAVGTVGVLTTLIAVFAFTQQKNWPMVEQSRMVQKECVKTFWQGCVNTLSSPWKALKLTITGV